MEMVQENRYEIEVWSRKDDGYRLSSFSTWGIQIMWRPSKEDLEARKTWALFFYTSLLLRSNKTEIEKERKAEEHLEKANMY